MRLVRERGVAIRQASRLLLGVEGDFSSAFGNATLSSRQQTIVPGVFAKTSADPKWLATATAGVGCAADNLSFYVWGGGAWEKVNYEAIGQTGGGPQIASQSQSPTRTRRCWRSWNCHSRWPR